ncbi:MAG: NAD(P)/FAD-dependent oxidoreductase [Thermonemataceae bacterium]
MKHTLQLILAPEVAFEEEALRTYIQQKLNISEKDTYHIRILRRSIDARSKRVKVNLKVEVFVNELPSIEQFQPIYPSVTQKPQAIIIGAGPAGLFAALRLIELGIKPIVVERGKDVRARRRDLAAINKQHLVNTASNYCFGEGGAGTYSDGKLYTRSKKRGDIRRILEILVAHGAKEEILVDAHPHIGTNKLPKIVAALRESILKAGGEVHFNTTVIDFILQAQTIRGVVAVDAAQNTIELSGIGVILATGHSARDIFALLHKKGILIEAKPFALGVRVEHEQSLIDRIQYHCKTNRGPYLPAASYSLVTQTSYQGTEKGVFSFCMCPGGFIVPAATAQEEIVVNGMSPSRRDAKYANSGIVVSVDESDWQAYKTSGALAALAFQKAVERKAWLLGGKTQTAPAQRLLDFVQHKYSKTLLPTSYQPGLTSVEMTEVLPETITRRLQMAFKLFGKKMKGYLTNDAQIIGVESRTSSPVKIPRDKITLEHVTIRRLFPCGEGAGYAGGIMSAAMDGERCAEQLYKLYGSGK